MSWDVFLGGCEFSMTFSILFSIIGCAPILVVVWPEAFQHWSLQVVGWSQILVPKCGPPRELIQICFPGTSTTSVFAFMVSHG